MKQWVQLASLAAGIVLVTLMVTLGARHFNRHAAVSRFLPVATARSKDNGVEAAAAASKESHSSAPARWRFDASAAVLLAPVAAPSQQRTFLLTLVPSRVDNERGRQAIRLSYGSVQSEHNRTVRTVFVVGRPASAAAVVDNALRRESEQHGDIVQFDFADTYLNLTLKTVLALHWAVTAYDVGRAPEYVLKADEDVLVNYERVVDLLLSLSATEREVLYTGYVWYAAAPIRNPANKYYVSQQQYAGATYPDYVAGPSYLLSAGAVSRVVNVSSSLQFLDMEDVFVGLCAQRAGLRATPNPNFGNSVVSAYDYCGFRRMITVHGVGPEWKERYWSERAAQNSGSRCDGHARRRSTRTVRAVNRGSGTGRHRYGAVR